jgi:isopenicillin-N N-acyltransferase-like protein
VVEAYLPLIAGFDPAYVDEMRGIAEGADIAFEQIVLLNARTELLKLAARPELRERLTAGEMKDGCTTVVVQPERASDGLLLHAHNWDWKATCANSCVILRVRRDDGPDLLTFTEAGALGRFGFNTVGISITGNYLECDRDYRRIGVPLALIRRKILEQDTPAMAMRVGYTTPKSGSNNLTLSHAASGVVHDLECAPDETFVVEPHDGLLIHANHWQSPAALAKLRETGIEDAPDSFWREQRLRRLLAGREKLSVARVAEALRDEEGAPWSICFAPRPSTMTGESATVASILMRPAIGEMQVAMMPALGGDFTRYTLDPQPALADA